MWFDDKNVIRAYALNYFQMANKSDCPLAGPQVLKLHVAASIVLCSSFTL